MQFSRSTCVMVTRISNERFATIFVIVFTSGVY